MFIEASSLCYICLLTPMAFARLVVLLVGCILAFVEPYDLLSSCLVVLLVGCILAFIDAYGLCSSYLVVLLAVYILAFIDAYDLCSSYSFIGGLYTHVY